MRGEGYIAGSRRTKNVLLFSRDVLFHTETSETLKNVIPYNDAVYNITMYKREHAESVGCTRAGSLEGPEVIIQCFSLLIIYNKLFNY